MYLIRERFFRLGEDSDITDEHGRPVLHVDGKVLSLRNRLVLRDPDAREVAQVQRKLIAMRPTYQFSIRRGGQTVATISKQWFSMGDTYAVDIAPDQDDCGASHDGGTMSAFRIPSRPAWSSRAGAQARQGGRML